MPRVYSCKHGCGYHRSRKAQVVEHEEVCKFAVLDRIIAKSQLMEDKLCEQDIVIKTLSENIDVLTKQLTGLLKRKRRDDADAAIYNFNWNKDFRFDREFFENVIKDTSNMSSIMDTMVRHYFERTPVFYKLGKRQDKLQIKGVIGLINLQAVGVDNTLTTIPFGRLYTVVIEMFIEELMDYHVTLAIEADEKQEADEELSSRLIKTMNLAHYRPKKADPRHNKMHRICRSRTIDIIYTTMKKQIKKNNTLVL